MLRSHVVLAVIGPLDKCPFAECVNIYIYIYISLSIYMRVIHVYDCVAACVRLPDRQIQLYIYNYLPAFCPPAFLHR